MFSNTIAIILVLFLIANTNTLETCSGAAADSQEDFLWKLNASSIVVYGKVTEVNGNIVTLKVSCILKGQFTESVIPLNQVANVNSLDECHYLTVNKDYIVFLERSKTTHSDNQISYQLMNLEEIEVNSNSLANFLDDECNDGDDYGIPMTIFYTDVNNKCRIFQAICNGHTKTSILNLNYPPLSKTSIFIGGIKYPLAIPRMDQSKNGMIVGKQSVAVGDESLRATATMSITFMPMVLIISITLTMMFNN